MIYTGQLTYKEVAFTFVFDGKKLRLIPSDNKRDEVNENWLRTLLANGAYTIHIPTIEDACLCGICNETNHEIIFLVKRGEYLTPYGNYLLGGNFVLIANVMAYIICKYNCNLINRISFSSPEIDAIHSLRNSFTFSLGTDFDKFNETGVVSVTTKDFDSTTTESQNFMVDNKVVNAYFAVWRGINIKVGEPPLSLSSHLMFEFEPTNEYEFILKLWRIAKSFITYLCYRRNANLPMAKLSAPYTDEKHVEFATLYIVGEDKKTNEEDIQKGRYISQQHIAGHEGQILEDIASGELYLRHIPESYESGRHKDAAKFVMITAAFEWEFKRIYPTGMKKSETALAVEKIAMEAIEKLFKESKGRLRDKYRYLKKRIKDDPLQSEIEQVGKDFSEIIKPFGEQLYLTNSEKLVYSEIGKRLADQRNHFAHGDLDKDFIDLSLLDLIFLERIVYAMQLKYYAIEAPKIQNAINDLFHCGFALPET